MSVHLAILSLTASGSALIALGCAHNSAALHTGLTDEELSSVVGSTFEQGMDLATAWNACEDLGLTAERDVLPDSGAEDTNRLRAGVLPPGSHNALSYGAWGTLWLGFDDEWQLKTATYVRPFNQWSESESQHRFVISLPESSS